MSTLPISIVGQEPAQSTSKSKIFVFGSNLAGRHGKGAALYARQKHGAIYGQGIGLQGNSYAIPTKDHRIKTLPLLEIEKHVNQFLQFAANNPQLQFYVTAIGCKLAGYKPAQIAPMFKNHPINVTLCDDFLNNINATVELFNEI